MYNVRYFRLARNPGYYFAVTDWVIQYATRPQNGVATALRYYCNIDKIIRYGPRLSLPGKQVAILAVYNNTTFSREFGSAPYIGRSRYLGVVKVPIYDTN